MNENIDQYLMLPPIEFFQRRQNRKATLQELLLLDYISEKYQFNYEIMNLFIEQVLKMNNGQFTRGFSLKVANEWQKAALHSKRDAVRYASHEYEKFIQFQKRDIFGEMRELSQKEKEIVNRIFYKSSLSEDILDCVIRYCMKINDGYIISWFINRLVEYLEPYHIKDKKEAEELLNQFHQCYVIRFGITEKGAVQS